VLHGSGPVLPETLALRLAMLPARSRLSSGLEGLRPCGWRLLPEELDLLRRLPLLLPRSYSLLCDKRWATDMLHNTQLPHLVAVPLFPCFDRIVDRDRQRPQILTSQPYVANRAPRRCISIPDPHDSPSGQRSRGLQGRERLGGNDKPGKPRSSQTAAETSSKEVIIHGCLV
jgi:hypothetical protein